MSNNMYAKIQEKGQITLPASLRKQYHLERGDMVIIVKTDDGILIKPAELVLTESLDAIGKELKDKGVDLAGWISLSEKSREELINSKDDKAEE